MQLQFMQKGKCHEAHQKVLLCYVHGAKSLKVIKYLQMPPTVTYDLLCIFLSTMEYDISSDSMPGI